MDFVRERLVGWKISISKSSGPISIILSGVYSECDGDIRSSDDGSGIDGIGVVIGWDGGIGGMEYS